MGSIRQGVEAPVTKAAEPAADSLGREPQQASNLGHAVARGAEADDLQAVAGTGFEIGGSRAPVQLVRLFCGQMNTMQSKILREESTLVLKR